MRRIVGTNIGCDQKGSRCTNTEHNSVGGANIYIRDNTKCDSHSVGFKSRGHKVRERERDEERFCGRFWSGIFNHDENLIWDYWITIVCLLIS